MKTIELNVSDLYTEGALVDIIIMPSIEYIKKKKLIKSEIPKTQVNALIDTGATSSCIDKSVINDIGLQCISTQEVKTPFESHICNLYATIFQIADTNEYFSLIVPEADLSRDNHKAIIGRDILKNCTFVYNGNLNKAFLIIN